jgi:phosphoribosylamine--glycine ligase
MVCCRTVPLCTAVLQDICKKYNIPTAAYESFTDPAAAKAYIQQQGAPIVVKTSGLAAGKGVTVAQTVEEACQAVDAMMVDAVFGDAGGDAWVLCCFMLNINV